ncbi:MAG: RNA polymerase sigma-54 factor, partial [Pseudomonadota bacterium]
MTALHIRADHRQSQALSPRLQHAVRLLQMSSLDFSAMVRDSLGQNPFLEAEEGAEGLPSESAPTSGPSSETEEADGRADATDAANETRSETDDGNDRDLWQGDGRSSMQRADDGQASVLDTMAVEAGLNSHLRSQLAVLHLSEREFALACTLVESLDDDGYL